MNYGYVCGSYDVFDSYMDERPLLVVSSVAVEPNSFLKLKLAPTSDEVIYTAHVSHLLAVRQALANVADGRCVVSWSLTDTAKTTALYSTAKVWTGNFVRFVSVDRWSSTKHRLMAMANSICWMFQQRLDSEGLLLT